MNLDAKEIPASNKTSLGLYVGPNEAYDMWKADPGSVYHGKHMRNGWKNMGLPWGYDFHPGLMWETASE
jgi:hypothetical protein